jgi:hypothetical protein
MMPYSLRAGNAPSGGGGAAAAGGVCSENSDIRYPQLSQHVIEVIVGSSSGLALLAFFVVLRHPERASGQYSNIFERYYTTNRK